MARTVQNNEKLIIVVPKRSEFIPKLKLLKLKEFLHRKLTFDML